MIQRVFNISSTDTQATVFRDDKAKEFIVAFPGTAGSVDWMTDNNFTAVNYTSPGVNCPGCHVHGGFLKAWNSIEPSLTSALTSYLKAHAGYKVTPTGHSLGGAMAILSYSSLKGLKFPVSAVYTFGQPRVVDATGAAYLDKLGGGSIDKIGEIVRVTHTDDGVPQAPSIEQGYRHCLTEIYELDTPSGNQSAATTWRCYGPESIQCDRGLGTGHFIDNAHGMYTGISFRESQGCGLPRST